MTLDKKYKNLNGTFAALALCTGQLFFHTPAFADEMNRPEPEVIAAAPQSDGVQAALEPAATPVRPLDLTPRGSLTKAEHYAKRDGNTRVGPGVLPPDLRLDPFVIDKYGAAPALVRFRLGGK
jgi:hypothetical protein